MGAPVDDQDTHDVLNRKVDPTWADLLSAANPQPFESKGQTGRSLMGSWALGFAVASALCLLLAFGTFESNPFSSTPFVFGGLWLLAGVGAFLSGIGALFARGPWDRTLGLIALGWVGVSFLGILAPILALL